MAYRGIRPGLIVNSLSRPYRPYARICCAFGVGGLSDICEETAFSSVETGGLAYGVPAMAASLGLHRVYRPSNVGAYDLQGRIVGSLPRTCAALDEAGVPELPIPELSTYVAVSARTAIGSGRRSRGNTFGRELRSESPAHAFTVPACRGPAQGAL